MTLDVWRDSQQSAGFIICVLTLPICTIATALRFVATAKSKREYGVENWFALIALVFFLVYTSIFLYLLTLLNGKNLLEFEMTTPPAEVVHVVKVGWAMSPQFCGNQLFTKLSLLFLYYRIFGVDKRFTRWLYVLGGVQIAWFISVYIVKWMLCNPVRYNWDKSGPGSCIAIGPFLAASETINSAVDFAMLGLAVWIVQSLHMSRSTKWRLSVLFSLGGLSGVVGIIKIGEAYTAAFNNILDPIWDIIQMSTNIICCCAPIYRSLFNDVHILKSVSHLLKSVRSSFGTSTKGSQNGTSEDWLPLEGSNGSDKMRTEVSAAKRGGTGLFKGRGVEMRHNDGHSDRLDEPLHPLKTTEVKQNVEYV